MQQRYLSEKKPVYSKVFLLASLLGMCTAPALATGSGFSQIEPASDLTAEAFNNKESNIDKLLSKLANEQQSNTTLLQSDMAGQSFASGSSLLATSYSPNRYSSDSLSMSPQPLSSSFAFNDSMSSNLEDEFDTDTLSRLSLVASSSTGKFRQNGRASWYGSKFHGRKTANGERFNMHAMTAAHRSLPFNTYLKVTNKSNGKSVIVKVNDRGPYAGNRILDLSYGAAKKIGMINRGVGNVTIEKVSAP